MAHTNSTTNYNLPQWVGSDKPTFLGDLNTAFSDIDGQMKTNADGIVAADDKAENAATLANDAQDDVDALTLRVTTAEGNIANNTTLIGNNTTSIDNLTSSIQTINTELTGKQNTITGGASTITTNNLTASRVLVSDSSGKVTNSSISDTELSRLSGVTSNIQTQINNIHSNDNLIYNSNNIPTSETTVTITSIANFVDLTLVLENQSGDIADCKTIPIQEFRNRATYLRDFSLYQSALFQNTGIIRYVSNTSIRIAFSQANYKLRIYGR